jgi:hypothetical protein
MRELPIYKAVINEGDETGVDFVSFVDKPAIEIDWQKFASNERIDFKTTDIENKIVSGALMVADTPIFRRDKKRGEYLVVFDKQTIQTIVEKFFKNQNNKQVNIMHDGNAIVNDVFMFESFIVSRAKNLVPKGFEDLPDGTWFGSYKIEDNNVWEKFIKSETLKGFSVEVHMGLELQDEESEILEKIDELLQILHNKK